MSKPKHRKKKSGLSPNLVQYHKVRRALWKWRRKDFSSKWSESGGDFLLAVRKVYDICKERGSKCTVPQILAIWKEVKSEDNDRGGEVPEINPDWLRHQPYWKIWSQDWWLADERITFWSPMILPFPSMFTPVEYETAKRNGDDVYAMYWRDFVQYGNDFYSDQKPDSDTVELCWRVLAPTYSDNDKVFATKRWWCEIIICDNNDERDDFGFVPSSEPTVPSEPSAPTPRPTPESTPQPPVPEAPTTSDQDKASQDRLQFLQKQKSDNLILAERWRAVGNTEREIEALNAADRYQKAIDKLLGI